MVATSARNDQMLHAWHTCQHGVLHARAQPRPSCAGPHRMLWKLGMQTVMMQMPCEPADHAVSHSACISGRSHLCRTGVSC